MKNEADSDNEPPRPPTDLNVKSPDEALIFALDTTSFRYNIGSIVRFAAGNPVQFIGKNNRASNYNTAPLTQESVNKMLALILDDSQKESLERNGIVHALSPVQINHKLSSNDYVLDIEASKVDGAVSFSVKRGQFKALGSPQAELGMH